MSFPVSIVQGRSIVSDSESPMEHWKQKLSPLNIPQKLYPKKQNFSEQLTNLNSSPNQRVPVRSSPQRRHQKGAQKGKKSQEINKLSQCKQDLIDSYFDGLDMNDAMQQPFRHPLSVIEAHQSPIDISPLEFSPSLLLHQQIHRQKYSSQSDAGDFFELINLMEYRIRFAFSLSLPFLEMKHQSLCAMVCKSWYAIFCKHHYFVYTPNSRPSQRRRLRTRKYFECGTYCIQKSSFSEVDSAGLCSPYCNIDESSGPVSRSKTNNSSNGRENSHSHSCSYTFPQEISEANNTEDIYVDLVTSPGNDQSSALDYGRNHLSSGYWMGSLRCTSNGFREQDENLDFALNITGKDGNSSAGGKSLKDMGGSSFAEEREDVIGVDGKEDSVSGGMVLGGSVGAASSSNYDPAAERHVTPVVFCVEKEYDDLSGISPQSRVTMSQACFSPHRAQKEAKSLCIVS